MKRALCIILSGILVLGILSGCGENETTGNLFNKETLKSSGLDFGGLKMPLTKNGDEISWLVTSEVTTLNDSYVVKKLRELTGVDLKLNIVASSTATEKINTLVASKQLNDIMNFGDTLAADLAAQGAIAAVEDYIDDLPNFKSIFVDREDTPRIFKSYSMADGKLYGFYGYDYNRLINTGAMLYRKDIFDKHNIPMWNSPETFYEALKKLKEAYPDSIPFSTQSGITTVTGVSRSWGILSFNPYYDEERGIWEYSDVTDTHREVLDYLKKLYDEGLLDAEFATRTAADWTSLMTGKNKSYVAIDWIGRMEMFAEQMAEQIPEYDLRFANPIGPKQCMIENTQLCWPRYVKKQEPEREKLAFQMLDAVLSPGGKQLVTMGIEGETFEFDENGKVVHPEFEGRTPQINELTEKYGMFIENMYLSFDRRSSYFNFSEREQEAQEFANDPAHISPIDPILAFTDAEKDEINEIKPKLKQAGEEFAMNYIVAGKCTDKDWEDWKSKADKLGATRMIELYNQAQARYDAE